MMLRRMQPADMRDAVSKALAEVLHGEPPSDQVMAAGQAIADAVAAHAASFAPASEPAYHDQHHQAEATIAMGWLCATAYRLGLLAPEAAVTGILAMAGHDLQHDGSIPLPGELEAHSADVTVALATRAGLDAAALATIRRVILATDPARPPDERGHDDLLCQLAREADLFGSLAPELGWQLSRALAREEYAARQHADPSREGFTGRLRLLRMLRPASPPARELGLDDAIADQIAALAAFGGGDADRGAAELDARPGAQARAGYLTALADLAPEWMGYPVR